MAQFQHRNSRAIQPPILLGFRDNHVVAVIGGDGIKLTEVDEDDISED